MGTVKRGKGWRKRPWPTESEMTKAAEEGGWVIAKIRRALRMSISFIYRVLQTMPELLARIRTSRPRYKGGGWGKGHRRPRPQKTPGATVLVGATVAVGHGAVAVKVAGEWHAWGIAALMRGEY